MGARIDRRIVTIPFDELDEYPSQTPRPQLATVREIDCKITGREISFFFSKAKYYIEIPNYPGRLKGLLKDIAQGNIRLPDKDGLNPPPPASPLSLKNKEVCYVIYRLNLRKNWQFAHDYPPFSIGPQGKAAECHFEARRVDSQGRRQRVVDRAPKKDNCKVAYFISNGFTATGFTGQYVHALNLHVELLFGSGAVRVPLIIDPDVRYPGGSGSG